MSDQLVRCPGCSDFNGFDVYHHKSWFIAGSRFCKIEREEFRQAVNARLKTTGAAWKPSHGPKPLLVDPKTGEPM
jgi:hypothetical protein